MAYTAPISHAERIKQQEVKTEEKVIEKVEQEPKKAPAKRKSTKK